MIFTISLLTTCLKFILIPAYRSTDFEVHRNWLAITYSKPIKEWYYENTSIWTIDYPPLFAYFEYLLSLIGSKVDPEMLKVDNLNYKSFNTILFQRISVILTDIIYIFGVYRCCCAIEKGWRTEVVLPILLITNCGLIMIDHIHFQYNGMLYGILLLSIANMLKKNYVWSAFWFTILINLKHIYLYMAPVYFVYLLQNYCIVNSIELKKLNFNKFFKHFATLGTLVITIFMLTYFPFYDHLGQVLSRLFPFKRGLCHAYWAPNFWAFYNVIDKILIQITPIPLNTTKAVMTGGLVQEYSHIVLPSITPGITLLLTAITILPALIKLVTISKHPQNFLRCLVICALTSFLFGWHVHEKAILMAIIPLSILAVMNNYDAKIFLLLQVTGHYSIFPILHPISLLYIKILLLIIYTIYAFHSLSKIYLVTSNINTDKYSFPLINTLETLYILGFFILSFYENIIHRFFVIGQKLPFLASLLTSFYCSVGILYCWVLYYRYFLLLPNSNNQGGSGTKTKKIQ